jgi:hypothetical protein
MVEEFLPEKICGVADSMMKGWNVIALETGMWVGQT